MRKIYILTVALLVTVLSFGQDLIITGAFDGPLTGGTPKMVELYVVNDIADLSAYGIGSANNGGGTDGSEFQFPADSYTAGDFIYVATEGSNAGSFNAYFGFDANYFDSSMGINGDDAVELFMGTTVIDTFGDINVDGNGEAWEYLDGWAYRNNSTGPDGAVFVLGNWSFSGINVNDNMTSNATATTPFPIGTYVNAGVPNPTLTITSPSNGQIFTAGDVDVEFLVANFNVANGTGDGHISYSVDGGASIMHYDANPISLTSLADGTHTVDLELVDNSNISLTTAVVSSVNFTVTTVISIATIQELRDEFATQNATDVYLLTGEVFVNHAQSFRGQKYIQDATAGILIDDNDGNITVGDRGESLSGISGSLSEFGGMLQFVPVEDATLVTSPTFSITPEVVTLADLIANSEMYEAELVQVEAVMLDNSVESTFVNNTDYGMTQGADSFMFRTFFGVDYTGENVPTTNQDIVGFVISRTTGYVFSPRDLADFQATASTVENTIDGLSVYPNPSNGVVNILTLNNMTKEVRVVDILGKQVLSTYLEGSVLNISSLNKGLYLLNITENEKTATVKLVVK